MDYKKFKKEAIRQAKEWLKDPHFGISKCGCNNELIYTPSEAFRYGPDCLTKMFGKKNLSDLVKTMRNYY